MALYEIIPTKMKGSGTYFKGRAGQALGRYKVVYKAANGLWYLADANAVATMPVIGVTLERVTTGQILRILWKGFVGSNAWAWTVGGEIYAHTVAGEITQTPPTPPDETQCIGIATKTNMILFDPAFRGTAEYEAEPIWIDPPNPDANLGDHDAMQMLDGVDTEIAFGCLVPLDFHALISAQVVVAHTTVVTWVQDMVWTVTTDFGEICADENYNAHSDNAGDTTTLDVNQLECLDVSDALTGLGAGDRVGFTFTRDGDNVLDTINGTVYFLGCRVRYR